MIKFVLLIVLHMSSGDTQRHFINSFDTLKECSAWAEFSMDIMRASGKPDNVYKADVLCIPVTLEAKEV